MNKRSPSPAAASRSERGTPPSPPRAEQSWRNRYQVCVNLARAALVWERLWPCLWPAVGVAALFVSVALMDWLPALPFWVHSLVLIVFAGVFGFMIRGAILGFRAVDEKTAKHRLERDSDFEHRPLTALHDRLADGLTEGIAGNATEALWQAHLRRMTTVAARLSVSWPSPGLARLDPYGLRAVVLLFLVIAGAGAMAGGDAWGRLGRALVPRLGVADIGALDLNIWITPPAYTGLAPIFLERPPERNKETAPAPARVRTSPPSGIPKAIKVEEKSLPPSPARAIKVPVGSTLLAQVGAAGRAPEMIIGDRTLRFVVIGGVGIKPDDETEDGIGVGDSYRLQTILEDADRAAASIEVRLGSHSLASWPLKVVADAPPEVEFTRAPGRTGRAQLRVDFEARDDYGLAGIQVVIRHPDGLSVPGGGPALRAELALPGRGSKKVEGSSLQDFSAHPWAGTPVLAQLQAIDARGQAGESDVIKIILPERIFNHPVARTLVELRKRLNAPTYDVVDEVVIVLEDLATRPKHFFDDTVVFLAISVAASRLTHSPTRASAGAVQTLLWETALRIEDGEFTIADRDLKKIQDRLMRALRNNEDAAEIERLMNELQQALDKYMTALAEHLQKQGLTQLPIDPNARTMDTSDLRRMIDEARKLARTGSREAARRMLSDLKRMLDGIRNGIQRGKPGKDMAKAKRLMEGLRKLTEGQRKALEKSFRRQQQGNGALGMRPDRGGKRGQGDGLGDGKAGKQEQDTGAGNQQALRRDLGKLMLGMDELLGGIPEAFGKAERAMNEAAQALRKGRFGDAVPLQTEALEQLRNGTDGLAERMARRLGGMVGIGRGQRGFRPGSQSDPFGRRPGGGFGASIDDGGVKIPDQAEQRRAWDLLRELRRRAGERQRPEIERNYIDRLLKRF